MKLLYDAFTEPEPHYAQIIKADKIKPIEVYPKEENKHPLADLGRQGRGRHAQRQQGDWSRWSRSARRSRRPTSR